MRVAIYTRISADKGQASPQTQEADCREWADEQGWEVVEVFGPEAVSGGMGYDRPKLDAAVAAAESDQYDGLLVWHPDRFGRGMDSVSRWLRLRAVGVDVWDHDSQQKLTEVTFSDKLSEAIAERERIRKRTVRGRRNAIEEGRWPGGLFPFGVVTDDEGYLIEQPEQAEAIRRGAKMLIEGASTGDVAQEAFNSRGVSTTRGASFKAQSIRRLYRQERLSQGFIDRPKWGGQVKHPVILSPGEHELVIQALNQSSKERGRSKHRSYPLSGRILCPDPDCEGHWVGMPDPRTGRRQYVCSRRYEGYSTHEIERLCGWKSPARIDCEPLEDEVWQSLMSILTHGDEWDRLKQAAMAALDTNGVSDESLSDQRQKVSRLEDKLASLYEQVDELNPSAFKKATGRIEQQLEAATDELTRLETIWEQRQLSEAQWSEYEQAVESLGSVWDVTIEDPAERLKLFERLNVQVQLRYTEETPPEDFDSQPAGDGWLVPEIKFELAPEQFISLTNTVGQLSSWMAHSNSLHLTA